MASRRDELNAYTFAKKRLVAQFLQPSPTGTEEGAPRPLRGIVPGLIVGVLIMAGFGAWGMFKPQVPKGWDETGKNVLIGSKSTTRYVVLETGKNKRKQLHPVLNLTSAKLLLENSQGGEPMKVDEKFLDSGKLPHGATIGIPYAPDRLPDAEEAGSKKRWVVCERPRGSGTAVQKAAFVLAEREEKKVEGEEKLRRGDVMYVEGSNGKQYLVDKSGTRYEIGEAGQRRRQLLGALVGGAATPQRVSNQWLLTLNKGDQIFFPEVDDKPGAPANVEGDLDSVSNRVGMVLKAESGPRDQHYVVVSGRVMPVSDFTAKLLLHSPELAGLDQANKAKRVNAVSFTADKQTYADGKKWPSQKPVPVNAGSSAASERDTSCNVLRDVSSKGRTTLSTWSGDRFPAQLPTGSSSAYVSPGSGQLFRQVKGDSTKSGGIFLVTDTGLRYAMQTNGDSAEDESDIGSDGKKSKEETPGEDKSAQARLGYENLKNPTPIPAAWSQFLPTGPRLSTESAKQPQGS
ncbi:type VII secretion protein EccB [Streptomyces albidus (ex Kaewkla and Franco 2022)]|uniref:type VII secretion protein EccB n=1 Tax=Streptomyces albidus (ex Kaewkla and Franco 2022) TaxID=722709 RepID=UPI0015EF49ED|nr:type VII secretion protein EccB [Streptomyces albidus (ex Kaewkla and Franco 2022)]